MVRQLKDKCVHLIFAGTTISLHGTNLNIHGPFQILIGGTECSILKLYVPCNKMFSHSITFGFVQLATRCLFLYSEDHFVVCKTAPFRGALQQNSEQHLVISWTEAFLDDQQAGIFTYKSNPIINNIHPQRTILRFFGFKLCQSNILLTRGKMYVFKQTSLELFPFFHFCHCAKHTLFQWRSKHNCQWTKFGQCSKACGCCNYDFPRNVKYFLPGDVLFFFSWKSPCFPKVFFQLLPKSGGQNKTIFF